MTIKSSKKIIMILYSYYPQDPRPRREIEALIEGGHKVDLICLRREDQIKREKVFGCNVYRVNLQRSRSSKLKYIQLYLGFTIRSFFVLNWLYIQNHYDAVHAHNMPDFLVFPAIIPKLLGAKIILDLHDPSPEMLMTIFNRGGDSRLLKTIRWIEKISIKFSDVVITTNKAFLETFAARGCPRNKIKIIMNSPQTSVFEKYTNNATIKPREDKFILMYHGFIAERHGLDTLVKALDMLRNKIPNLEMIVCGYGEYTSKFLEDVKNANLEGILNFIGEVTIDKIAEIIPRADVGIIPNKVTPFTEINFPTRIFEYIINKKPAVVPYTRGISDYFNQDEIFYFRAGNENDLCRVILDIYSNPQKTAEIINKSYEIYKKYTWDIQSRDLNAIYDSF